MEAVLGFLVVLAIVALLFFFLSMLARRAYMRRQRSLELHAPLLDFDDRRLDAALRDAEEGFNVCSECGFENFKRFKFCTVCGEALVERDGDAAAADKKRSTRLSLLPLFKRESRVELVTATHSVQTSRRLARAQRRKEWTRKVDVEGRAYWFRDGRWGDTQFAGFVVRFLVVDGGPLDLAMDRRPTTPSLEDEKSMSEGHSTVASGEVASPRSSLPSSASVSQRGGVEASTSTDTTEPEPEQERTTAENADGRDQTSRQHSLLGSVEECIAGLVRDAQTQHAVLTVASDPALVASKLPLEREFGVNAEQSNTRGETPTPPASTPMSETMALASKDFPSKYAHFVTATSALLVPAEREHLRLNVERANVFADSMESLAIIPLKNVHSVLRINFLDESGVDAGGLHREWFVLLNEMLVDPAHGLFVCTNKSEQTYFLSPCSNADLLPDQLLHLYATGRLLGRALLEGSMMCFHLAPPLLKLMLGYPLSFSDLEDIDPEVYTNMRWLLENDNVDALGLDFVVTVKDGGRYRDVELVPGGNTIPVTDSNKRDYVERKWQYLMVESVAPQLQVFLHGLYEIIPKDLLLLFDPEELNFLLCGSDEIDVDDWERHAKYSEDLHHHRALKWFWELVREMPNEYRRRLLQFSTGSSRVPLGGFRALTSYDGRLCPFTLKAVSLVGDGFVHSHACFNRLDLPLHVVREELKAVLYAVLETEVYGFTTD
ncbi:NEDD4 E3 ubiquitin-protein ligase WWP1 [Phytophthora cinnamomi]|uniref:NEDD4 E3 ubiquitin-protein ligase WWP1 n=1 Tax=Phytophthora cinnamomi TaxID=4785 RepID=UPI003559ABE2|nr:NEDD4 E3 ubiquitin-protein ligase WWP1 [Phytophthora cinnamomi]